MILNLWLYIRHGQSNDDVITLANFWAKKKVQIILNELYPNENVDVPDPYWYAKWFWNCHNI
jgi:protein-tyrosine phosphatase